MSASWSTISAAAIEFFVGLGLELRGRGVGRGRLGGSRDRSRRRPGEDRDAADAGRRRAGRAVGVRLAPSQDGDSDAPSNARGIRHLSFAVDDIDALVAGLRGRGAELVGSVENYEDIYRLCYVRGPEGIIVELAQKIG